MSSSGGESSPVAAIDKHLGTVANTYYVANYPGATISAQIAAALTASTAGAFDQNAIIVLPAGKFTVAPNVFSSWGQSHLSRGLIIKGAGTYATQLTLTTGGVSSWFYDNGTQDVGQFWRFEDLTFLTDDTTGTVGNFMRLTGRGNEQHFTFKSCVWGAGFTRIFDFEGSVGCDSVRTYDCHMNGASDCAFYINNPQAVLNEHFGLNAEGMTGDLVHVGPNGGGDVKFFGGSFILYGSATAGKKTWLVNVDDATGSGSGNSWFGFYGARTELRAQTNGYVYAIGNRSLTNVSFIGGNYFTASATTPHDMVHLGAGKSVTFTDTRISTSTQVLFEIDNASAPGLTEPVVRFDRCEIPNDMTTANISYLNSTPYGRVIASGCHLLGTVKANPNVAMDFDYNASNAMAGGPAPVKKIAMVKATIAAWPNSSGYESTIILPSGAYIQHIYVNKPAEGGSTASYQLAVSNDDKSVVYGTSGAANLMKYQQIIDVQPGVFCGTDTTSRTVRLYAPTTGDATYLSGGICYVEYI